MSYFDPNLVPGRHMIDALVSRDDFHQAIDGLEKRIAMNLIYVRDQDSLIVAPFFHLSCVVSKAKTEKRSAPGYAEYLVGLEKEWVSIIANAAIEHPMWKEIFSVIPKVLDGDYSAKKLPKWVKHFYAVITTGDDDVVHVPSYMQVTTEQKPERSVNDSRWGVSSEPTADLFAVLEALGYPSPPRGKRGRKAGEKK